ncbi:MAG: alpha/beta fold hydrolase [Woeseiaceae bacterium]|nr:alpha/beta fold hydrolase [Woeseiaceae bacterium]
MTVPETVEVETGSDPSGAVIWLHGLGADGHDFEPVVAELALPDELPLRFVFPHAPVRPVTINAGMSMRAWFDIRGLDREAPVDETGIGESVGLLRELVTREQARGIVADRIVLAGFSQGGAIAMHTALGLDSALAGLMVLSSWLPPLTSAGNDAGVSAQQPKTLPIFMAHGEFDPMLPLPLGENSRARLEKLGYRITWRSYPMAHAVCAEEIADIRRWLVDCF